MKTRMAGVILFFVLAAIWAVTMLTVQTFQTFNYR